MEGNFCNSFLSNYISEPLDIWYYDCINTLPQVQVYRLSTSCLPTTDLVKCSILMVNGRNFFVISQPHESCYLVYKCNPAIFVFDPFLLKYYPNLYFVLLIMMSLLKFSWCKHATEGVFFSNLYFKEKKKEVFLYTCSHSCCCRQEIHYIWH
jgi:hypothetical protein